MRYAGILALLAWGVAFAEPPLIEEAEQFVSHGLKDPGSAQFRDVEIWTTSTGAEAVCGEVNGKNSFGGYVGFKQFAYSAGVVVFEGESIAPVVIPALCATRHATELGG